MGMGITAQALARVKDSDPDKHEVLKKLWERSFGNNITTTQVQQEITEAKLTDTGNKDIDFVISSIKLNISSQ
tara:strand:+ start:78 stop:296 length:219 start_codon:yes stop_codon:yes gene_type:complete